MSTFDAPANPDLSNDEDLLEVARKRFAEAAEGWREVHREARLDLQFLAGQQWDAKTKLDREAANRPALVINKLPTFWAQVANEARQNKPGVRISPLGGGATVDLAKVMQGIVRHIEYQSNADVAYNTAFEYATGCGIGYYRIRSDYVDERSFDQELSIDAIEDPFTVYLDPNARKPDRSDGRYAFIVTTYSAEEYKAKWGASATAKSNFFADGLPYEQDWVTRDNVRVAEYFYFEPRRRKLLGLSTGVNIFEDEIGTVPENVKVVSERWEDTGTVKIAVLNGCEVLDRTDWDGKAIPIIAVTGKEIWIDGKRQIFSLIRFARDPQQLYNFYKTAQAESVQLAPKSPWIMAEGQAKGHEQEWARANNVNYAYLEYKPVTLNGTLAPPPQRNVWEPPIQALTMGAMQAADDIKATTGIFDPSLGAEARETSGIAIQRRQHESDVSNFHLLDNLARAQRYGGQQLVDLIPRRYDTPREMRIVGEDEAERVIRVNQKYVDENHNPQHYDLALGRYDVRVETGPSFTTKRDEAFQYLSDLTKANPNLIMIVGDLLFRNSDVAGADQIADRMKQVISQANPNLNLDDEGGGKQNQQIPPQFQAKMAALAQQHDQLAQALQQATQKLESKAVETASRERIAAEDRAARERIAAMQTQAQLITTEAQLRADGAVQMLQADLARIQAQIQSSFDGQAAALERQHEAEQQQFAQDHEANQAAAAQQHQAAAADADRQHRQAMAQQAQAAAAEQQDPAA